MAELPEKGIRDGAILFTVAETRGVSAPGRGPHFGYGLPDKIPNAR